MNAAGALSIDQVCDLYDLIAVSLMHFSPRAVNGAGGARLCSKPRNGL